MLEDLLKEISACPEDRIGITKSRLLSIADLNFNKVNYEHPPH